MRRILMTFKQSITILLICSSVMLAACATKHKSDDSAISDANSAYQNDDAQSSGMGGSSGGYGDDSDPMHRVYYFDYDSNVVRDNDRQAIIANADTLSAHPSTKALVEGHTDPRGSRE